MPAKPPASLVDALASLKGAALLVPAILLVGATLAVGQSAAATRAGGSGRRTRPRPRPGGSRSAGADGKRTCRGGRTVGSLHARPTQSKAGEKLEPGNT